MIWVSYRTLLPFTMSEPEVLTTEDLRNRMFEVLKKRGLVDVLKVSETCSQGVGAGFDSEPGQKLYKAGLLL